MTYKVIRPGSVVEIVTRHATAQEALAKAAEQAGSLISGPDGERMSPADFQARIGIVGRF